MGNQILCYPSKKAHEECRCIDNNQTYIYGNHVLSVYMPCDNNTDDHVFINVLNTISQLLEKYNPCHIIIGGDMYVDFSRSSPNTPVLSDFLTDFNLYTCINLPNTNALYTFINYNNSTSRIDHFLFVSESFSRAVDNCNIINNHLFSDHVPLRLDLLINVDYITVTSRPFSVKQAWYIATQCDIDTYKTRLDDILSHVSLCDDVLYCDDQYCSVHKDEIVDFKKSVVNACITASDHIPTTSPSTAKVMPDWNVGVNYLRDEALSWHHFWKINGHPRAGHIAEMHRISRARYHRSIRHIQRNEKIIQSEKMAHAVVSVERYTYSDLWS